MLPRTIRRSFIQQRCVRQYQSSALRAASKPEDMMDKDKIDTTSNEYSQSGGDGQAAGESTAFDPKTTRPEGEMQQSGSKNKEGGSLNASPANHEISHTDADKQRGQPQGSKDETGSGSGRQRTSGGGSPTKSGGGQSGGGTAG